MLTIKARDFPDLFILQILFYFRFFCIYISKMNILSRADCCAGVTADTFSGVGCISVNIQMCRTSLFAECTLRCAFGTISFEKRSRDDRHDCKYRPHRTQELAEETFLCTHSDHDQNQQNCSHNISRFRQSACCEHGKYIPRTHSL